MTAVEPTAPRRDPCDERHNARSRTHRSEAGFTLVELLIVLGIVLILLAIALPTIARIREQSASVKCLNNLRQINTGFLLWSAAHDRKYPDPAALGLPWEQVLSRETGTHVFVCPGDSELAPVVGSSYDWRDTGHPGSTLAGKHVASVTRSTTIIVFDSLPGWHRKAQVNVARQDASAQTIPHSELVSDLVDSVSLSGAR